MGVEGMASRISHSALAAAALALLPVSAVASQAEPGHGLSTQTPPTGHAMATNAPQERQQRPNVLVWMLDDVGFAQFSSYGGLVATPNIDRVAANGLRYTNYHTAPVCSAARASFLTGRMPHSVNIGGHVAVSRPYPGYTGRMPDSAGTIADNLRAAGYATFALGKWDHIPNSESTPAGPFRQWPTGQGFERFYGFLSADIDNWHPSLVRDQSPVATPYGPDYHLNDDLADEAIAMIETRRATDPARPFLMYWATGTAHAPHHAPLAWIERYRGKFDQGWDKVRETILAEQKAKGLVPQDAKLAPRPEGQPAWDTLSAGQKKLYARQMEVFAASLSHADEQFGRILDALEEAGELDNTLVIVTSDNGASAEGAQHGMFTEAILSRQRPATLEENMPFYEEWGGPGTYPHYSYGWAVAGNTPFRYYKHATFEGGTRVPLVVSWPDGIAARGELRRQYAHVSDIAPTILEAAQVPLAPRVNNVEQSPMEGVSFAHSFTAPDAPTRKQAQYTEMFGNKGLWQDGWTIVTSHRLEPWDMSSAKPITAPWELYDLETDIGQSSNLAARYPERVAAMDRLFEEQAARYNVNPIGNISEGMLASMAGARAEFERRGGVWRYPGPVRNISPTVGPPIMALGFRMTADLKLPAAGVTGPVFAAGGTLGGIGLYLRDGRPVFAVNTIAGQSAEVAASESLGAGGTRLRLEFARAGKDKPAAVAILAGDKLVAQGEIPAEVIQGFYIFELFGVGHDGGTPVIEGVEPDLTFPGRISDVSFDFRPPNTASAGQGQ
jgi:arylsulfatase A-like enzyme